MSGAKRARVAWSGPPDPERAVGYEKRSPEPGKPVLGVILSEVIVGAVVWYDPPAPGKKGRSQPCTGDRKTCQGCLENRDHAWKGYFACFDAEKGRLYLAEVTRAAYLLCPAFELYKGRLRGKALRLVRNGKAPNSRVTATLGEYVGPISDLPPAFNVEACLERMWFGGDRPGEVQGA